MPRILNATLFYITTTLRKLSQFGVTCYLLKVRHLLYESRAKKSPAVNIEVASKREANNPAYELINPNIKGPSI